MAPIQDKRCSRTVKFAKLQTCGDAEVPGANLTFGVEKPVCAVGGEAVGSLLPSGAPVASHQRLAFFDNYCVFGSDESRREQDSHQECNAYT